jgi:hypothetical protein
LADKKDNSLYENGIGWGIMLVVLAVLLWLFWYYFDDEIRNVVRWIRYTEMWILQWFIDNDRVVTYDYNGKPVTWKTGFNDTTRWDQGELTYSPP